MQLRIELLARIALQCGVALQLGSVRAGHLGRLLRLRGGALRSSQAGTQARQIFLRLRQCLRGAAAFGVQRAVRLRQGRTFTRRCGLARAALKLQRLRLLRGGITRCQ